ncbi:methyl-accepting chemotaxis protein, partial [candidate division KSB1 bacterium]
MKWTIGKKLGAGFGACVVVLAVIVLYNFTQLQELRVLQDEGAGRAEDAMVITECAGMGYQLYQVVADAQINRELDVTKGLWEEIKTEAEMDLENVEGRVDTPEEKALIAEAKGVFEEIVALFEEEMWPRLEKTGDLQTEVEIRELDGQIDEKVGEFVEPMTKISESLNAEMVEADAEFDGIAQSVVTVSVTLGIIGALAAIIIAFFITRAIVNPVTAMKEASEALAVGNINQEIKHSSSDETGQLADSFRSMIDALKSKAQAAEDISRGDLGTDINVASEDDVLGISMVKMKDSLDELIVEGKALAQAAEDGDLKKRGETSKFEGAFREIIEGMNNTTENILKPVNEAVGCLKEMAKGDLRVEVTGNYKGDHAVMKNSMNQTLDSLNDLMGQVLVSVDQVSSGSQQVSDSSQSLSQGATEQASSLEETSASITQIAAQTKTNAESATQANTLASSAKDGATTGNNQMKKMVEAMGDINQSSTEISKIIKVI